MSFHGLLRVLERKNEVSPPFLFRITYRIVRLLVGIGARTIRIVGGGRILCLATRICIGGGY